MGTRLTDLLDIETAIVCGGGCGLTGSRPPEVA